MKKNTGAMLFALAFLILVFLGQVNAVMTVEETTVSARVPMASVLFSLSSAAVLLLPLTVCLMAIALISMLKKRSAPAMLFSALSTLSFLLFLFLYSQEEMNNSLYNILNELMKEAGVKFRKRDVSGLGVAFTLPVYLALAFGILATALSAPNLGHEHDRRLLRRDLLPYAYIGPHLFFFIIFFITPAIYGIYAAFTKWNLFNDPPWVGFENFETLLFQKGNTYYFQLRNGLWNTIKFVVFTVPFAIILPLGLAFAMQSRPRGSKFFQALYYLPSLMSITTVTLSWRYMFFKSYGVMNHFFMSQVDWFVPPYSWVMLVVVTVWWVNGGTMVIYQSALASVPHEHYEAASVDGANEWHKFRHITLPGIRFPLMYTLVLAVVAQFNIYGQPLILTGFGNNEANAVLLMYVYENAVKQQAAGMSAAMALILGLCILSVSFVQMRLMRANTPA